MSDKPTDPKPSDIPPTAAPAPVAKPAPKPAPVKIPLPEPKLNLTQGRLLQDRFATWPQPIFDSKWSRPSYRMGAGLLIGLVITLPLMAAFVGELSHWGDVIYKLIAV
jgi:hypothetical protein